MLEKLKQKAEKLLNGYDWEIYLQRLKKVKAESQNFKVDSLIVSEEIGYSIRVLKDGKQGFSYGTSLEDNDITNVIKKAKETLEISSRDEHIKLVDRRIETEKIEYFDTFAQSLPVMEKAEKAIEIERYTKSYSELIKKVRNPMFIETIFEKFLLNSYGIEIHEKGTVYTAMVAAIAENNKDSQISWGYKSSRFLDELDIKTLCEETAQNAVQLLGATPIKTGSMHVMFSPYVSSEFLNTFSYAFSGEALLKGKTMFKELENSKVASEKLSIIDDGRLKLGTGTTTYDDEGIPTQKTVIIENGVFKGFLHNTYTGSKTNHESTGNGFKHSIKSLPSISITNLYIQNTDEEITNVLKDIDRVFLVTDVMGLHTADPISGNFSIGASGILIENGKKTVGVRGVTIAGNFMDLLNSIVSIGNDLKFYGNTGSPSILFKDVMVAGE